MDDIAKEETTEKCVLYSEKVLDVLESAPDHICMATLATLLVHFAQLSDENLESFMGKMVRVWMSIRSELDKRKSEFNENDGSDGQE